MNTDIRVLNTDEIHAVAGGNDEVPFCGNGPFHGSLPPPRPWLISLVTFKPEPDPWVLATGIPRH